MDPDLGPPKIVKIASWRSWGALGVLLGRSWALFGRGLLLFGASWVRQGPPGAKKIPPGAIWGAILAPKTLIFGAVVLFSRGSLFVSLFYSCLVPVCSEIYVLCVVRAFSRARLNY